MCMYYFLQLFQSCSLYGLKPRSPYTDRFTIFFVVTVPVFNAIVCSIHSLKLFLYGQICLERMEQFYICTYQKKLVFCLLGLATTWWASKCCFAKKLKSINKKCFTSPELALICTAIWIWTIVSELSISNPWWFFNFHQNFGLPLYRTKRLQ